MAENDKFENLVSQKELIIRKGWYIDHTLGHTFTYGLTL